MVYVITKPGHNSLDLLKWNGWMVGEGLPKIITSIYTSIIQLHVSNMDVHFYLQNTVVKKNRHKTSYNIKTTLVLKAFWCPIWAEKHPQQIKKFCLYMHMC